MKSSLIAVLIAGWAGIVSADKPAKLPSAVPAIGDPSLAAGRAVLKGYVDRFNAAYPEKLVNAVPDADACRFLEANIPLFECPDTVMEEIYYFRWWTYRKHIKKTPAGFVVTEFLPNVGWAGSFNTINCPVGHQIYEGRWLRDPKFMDDYIAFHFGKGGDAGGGSKQYSNWLGDAIYARYLVNHDREFVTAKLDGLIANHEAYSKGDAGMSRSRLVADVGLYWQIDSWDGMEHSIGGTGIRPTISSYMYGSAKAIAEIARLAGREEVARRFQAEAEALKQRIQRKLWDPEMKFFKVLRDKGATSDYSSPALEECPDGRLVKACELIGYIPWYFNLPDDGKGYEEAWKQLVDPRGFKAPYGPCFAERRHPRFQINRGGCEWRGASWPYATSQALTAMANLLNNYRQQVVGTREYFDTLRTYAASHYFTRPDGSKVAWIDESLDPDSGKWITNDGAFPETRGRYYNHSTFCDLIITGLVGLRPRPDDIVEVNPLVPEGTWDWFKLDNIAYHGRTLTILWDKTGNRYNRGKGMCVLAAGRLLARSDTLQRMKVSLERVDAAPEGKR
jgi:hypothetical protein